MTYPIHLFDVRNPDGTKRFYPPNEHPATARWRTQLAKAKEVGDITPAALFSSLSEIDKYIDWIEQKLAEFEFGENRAKHLYLSQETNHTKDIP